MDALNDIWSFVHLITTCCKDDLFVVKFDKQGCSSFPSETALRPFRTASSSLGCFLHLHAFSCYFCGLNLGFSYLSMQ